MSEYCINVAAVADCALVVSKDENRLNLHGVSIKDINGVRHYAGTNGSILVHCEEPINYGDELPEELIFKIFGKIKVKKDLLYGRLVIIDERLALMDYNGQVIGCEIITDEYPDYTKVIPAADIPVVQEYASFNPDYLKIKQKITGLNGDLPKAEDSNSAHLWECQKNGCDYQIVLMPTRI